VTPKFLRKFELLVDDSHYPAPEGGGKKNLFLVSQRVSRRISTLTATEMRRSHRQGNPIRSILMRKDVYLSGDELERAQALKLGYHTVCQHPNELGELNPGETLVIDFDHCLFDDHDQTVAKAHEAANHGSLVGIHTHNPEDSRLRALVALKNVVVAKNSRHILAALRRQARAVKGPVSAGAAVAQCPGRRLRAVIRS
jgi:hypothetical protein